MPARRVRIKPPRGPGHLVSRAGQEGTVVPKESIYAELMTQDTKDYWDLLIVFDARETAEGYMEHEVEDV
jgi:hypothetical protein